MKNVARRNLSADSHQAHHEATMAQWRKITYIAIPVVGALAVINFVVHMSHEHHESEPVFGYQKIAKKNFPWECKKCGLFEVDCWKKCREEAKNNSK